MSIGAGIYLRLFLIKILKHKKTTLQCQSVFIQNPSSYVKK
jgi:hypothetical protein